MLHQSSVKYNVELRRDLTTEQMSLAYTLMGYFMVGTPCYSHCISREKAIKLNEAGLLESAPRQVMVMY